MKITRNNLRNLLLTLSFFPCLLSNAGQYQAADSLQAHFTVYQVDSLIQANVNNPDFVVMDVRTPGEYLPEHLEGAINRNYNGAGFDSLLNLLPRHKMYVLYCHSGGRSGNTYIKMVSMGFPHVINMLGGITAWKNESLLTTPDLAPLQMAVSDTMFSDSAVYVGEVDTILLTVTNRANDTLRFTSFTSLEGTEFSSDFDTTVTLEGPFDYTFSVFYTPVDTISDSTIFLIESNGGPVQFHIRRTGRLPLVGLDELAMGKLHESLRSYPNPFSSTTTIEYLLSEPGKVRMTIFNHLGQRLKEEVLHGHIPGKQHVVWNAYGLPEGVYFVRISTGKESATRRIIKLK